MKIDSWGFYAGCGYFATWGLCGEIEREIPDASIDLVVSSPPYDNLREYKGYSFEFVGIEISPEYFELAKQRITNTSEKPLEIIEEKQNTQVY